MPYQIITDYEPTQPYLNEDGKVSVEVSYLENTPQSTQTNTITDVFDKLEMQLEKNGNSLLTPESIVVDSFAGRLIGTQSNELVKLSEYNKGNLVTAAKVSPYNSLITVTDWVVGDTNTFVLLAAATHLIDIPISELAFRTSIAPIKPDSLQLIATRADTNEQITIGFNGQGVPTLPFVHGKFDYTSGLGMLSLYKKIDLTGRLKPQYITQNADGTTKYNYIGDLSTWTVNDVGSTYRGQNTFIENDRIYGYEPVPLKADSVFYNAVGYTYLPLDKDIIGVDTVKLPPSGKVPAYRRGDLILVRANKQIEVTDTSLNTLHNVGKERLVLIELVDSLGNKIPYNAYDVDLDAGTYTLLDGFPNGTFKPPYFVNYQFEDMAVASDVSISGEIKLTKQLTHDFLASDTNVASAMLLGTMQARVTNMFTQEVWNDNFLDYREGDDSVFKYDTSVAPIIVTNKSAINDRMALVFKSSTSFDLIGENTGKIATGNVTEDFTPLNPVTNQPIFTMKATGFSGGAKAGNALRFNLIAANYPVWIVRTVLQSNATNINHEFSLEFKGSKDRII